MFDMYYLNNLKYFPTVIHVRRQWKQGSMYVLWRLIEESKSRKLIRRRGIPYLPLHLHHEDG